LEADAVAPVGRSQCSGIFFGGKPAPTQRSSCPEFGTMVGISVAMLVATTTIQTNDSDKRFRQTIHSLVTFIQAGLIHTGKVGTWCSSRSERRLLLVVIGVLMMAADLFLDIVLWAWVYRRVSAIQDLEARLYFSDITVTTDGYGDVTLAKCWKLLSVGQAENGVLMASWSTAQLIFLVQRMMTINLHSEA
jgi:hypothetical protein